MNCKVKFDIPCVIQNALTLPKGWKWTMYCDGSGHISDPVGRTIFSYDLVAQVFEENVEVSNLGAAMRKKMICSRI